MKKVIINIIVTFCVVLVAKTMTHVIKPTIKEKVISQIEHQDSQMKDKINDRVDSWSKPVNNKWNQFKTLEEAQDDARRNLRNVRDGGIEELAVPMGFLASADAIKEFCEPVGYIPQKYIDTINSYPKDIDFDEKFISMFMDVGADKQKAKYVAQALLEKAKETSKNQFHRLSENEYQTMRKDNPSFTKKEYCKLYDEHAEEMVSAKIKELKEAVPSAYEKYFVK